MDAFRKFMDLVAGKKTIICWVGNMVMAFLAMKGLIKKDSGVDASQIFDVLMNSWQALATIVIIPILGIIAHLRTRGPGPLAPDPYLNPPPAPKAPDFSGR